jgi:hypothetical protein
VLDCFLIFEKFGLGWVGFFNFCKIWFGLGWVFYFLKNLGWVGLVFLFSEKFGLGWVGFSKTPDRLNSSAYTNVQ